ncbi:uncharacterized protein LOC132268475 [Cornus florida]|uniref:uncharacterized protein LOC132268475 n=1 Tax=Cornus florida TaxID=4283 RepID=UPI00289AD927|nr:uncharacterized protein LOC132268475 [Cornus florida]
METIKRASVEYIVEIPVSQLSKNLMFSRYDPKTGRFVYVNSKSSGEMLTPDSQHVLPNCGNEEVEIEKMLQQAGALRAKELFIHDSGHDAVCHCREGSHKPSQNVITGQREFLCCVLLLMAALVAKITYQAAFSFSVGALKEGYAYNYAANGILQLKKRDSIANRSFMLFNSSGFVASVAVIISLLHEFPLKPWPQISASTLFGSYMCLVMATSPRDAFVLLFLAIPLITLAAAGKLYGFARERSY